MKRFLVLPAISVVYYLLSFIFGLPSVDHVLGLLTVATIGLVLYTMKSRKYDGWFEVEIDQGGVKRVSFVVAGDPETALETKDVLTFCVKRGETQ